MKRSKLRAFWYEYKVTITAISATIATFIAVTVMEKALTEFREDLPDNW